MGTVPDPHDWAAWQGFTDDAALQARATGHSNVLNFEPMPRYHRMRINFTDEVHEYYWDGVLVNAPNDPDRWPSPSSLHLWPGFDEMATSARSARAAIERALRECLFPRPPPGPDRPQELRALTPAEEAALTDFLAKAKAEGVKVTRAAARKRLFPPEAPKVAPLEKPAVLWDALLARSGEVDLLCDVISPKLSACFHQGAPTREEHQAAIDNLLLGVHVHGPEWHALPEPERTAYEDLQRAAVAALAEDLRHKWEGARSGGRIKHEGYDRWCQHDPVPPDIVLPLGFKRAMALLFQKYDIYGTEIPIADEFVHVVGCFDLLLIDRETGELIVADFKNCNTDDLADSGGSDYGTHPFTRHLQGTKLNHYRFQVSFYRHILELHYFPGRMSRTCILININPADPDCAQIHYLEAMEMAPFWVSLRQRLDLSKPKGQQQNNDLMFRESEAPTLVSRFPDTDPRCQGKTKRVRLPRGAALPDDVVWTQPPCTSKAFPQLPGSVWAHPTARWFGKVPPEVAPTYELYLLNRPKLLLRLPELVGKKLACWCYEDKPCKCNCGVLVKYVNLLDKGAFSLDFLASLSPIELNVLDEKQAARLAAAAPPKPDRKKRARVAPSTYRERAPGELAFVRLTKESPGLD